MTPLDAHKYANKHKVDIWEGPNYIKGKKEKDWDGFGYHSGLMMSFKGPRHYREYLKEHNMVDILDNINNYFEHLKIKNVNFTQRSNSIKYKLM